MYLFNKLLSDLTGFENLIGVGDKSERPLCL
jgi:hypothetical protein